MQYKRPKLFGVDEDGCYEARIEAIQDVYSEKEDMLFISNRKASGALASLINGYRQLGTLSIKKGHGLKIGQDVIVTKKCGKIVGLRYS